MRIEPSDDPDGFEERIVLPLWRSMHSLNLMLAKEDRTAMLLRIFNDTTPLVNNHNGSSKMGKPPPAAANGSIEGAAPVAEGAAGEAAIKPGPYGTIVGDKDNAMQMDVKAENVHRGTGEEGSVEGQLGSEL